MAAWSDEDAEKAEWFQQSCGRGETCVCWCVGVEILDGTLRVKSHNWNLPEGQVESPA